MGQPKKADFCEIFELDEFEKNSMSGIIGFDRDVRQPGPIFGVHKSLNRLHNNIHSNRIVWVGLIFALLAVLVSAVWLRRSPEQPEQVQLATSSPQHHVNDPHYNLDLPIGWKKTDQYTAGAKLNVFYSTTQQTGELAVYALPFTKSRESSAVHASNKIASLSQDGNTTKTLDSQKVMFGATEGVMTTVLAQSIYNASVRTCYVFANVNYGKVAYNLDLKTRAADCSGSRLLALQDALGSFIPKSASL